MAKYRIKVTGLLCKNKHVAKGNEIVDESQLLAPVADLIKDGFIELVEEVKKTEPNKSKSVKKD